MVKEFLQYNAVRNDALKLAYKIYQEDGFVPDVIYCSGWMAALVPLYVKKAYADTPFFENAKVVVSLDDQEYATPFGTKFADKMLVDGVLQSDVRSVAGLPVGYEDLMRLAIDNADAIVLASPTVNTRLYNYAYNSGKPLLPYGKPIASLDENKDGEKGKEGKEESQRLMDFLNSLINQE